MSRWAERLQRWHACALAEGALQAERRRVDLSELGLDELPEGAECADTSALAKLFLHANRLRALSVPAWPRLTVLTLDYNRLTALPALHHLPHLRYLNVSHNPLGALPPELGRLHALQTLWANCTELRALPEQLGLLRNLRVLGARKNKIRRLPRSTLDLAALSWVTLQDNVLEELPEGLSQLQLVHLNVSMNCLRELPADFVRCKDLQYFKANHNQIHCLPFAQSSVWDLSGMESIVYIDIRENPIIEDPHYVKRFKKYPQFKTSNDPRTVFDEVEEVPEPDHCAAPAESSSTQNPETNEAEEEPAQDNAEDDDSDSSSYDDWEHSICSHHLNYEEQSEDDLEDNEIKGINISVISKFAGTGS